jgi:hypothetical protein
VVLARKAKCGGRRFRVQLGIEIDREEVGRCVKSSNVHPLSVKF